MSATLELRDLACVRGGRRLFGGLNVALPAGQWLRVGGANGAGKTSLLRIVCGLHTPAAGQVLWRGRPLAEVRDDFHCELVYLGHAAALKDDLSALQNLLVATRLAGRAADEPAARRALTEAGLGGREHLPTRVLSQGQRRRAALARLALQPASLWVLDEPFNALDSAATGWLQALIEAQLRRGGNVVLTSHQPLALAARIEPVGIEL